MRRVNGGLLLIWLVVIQGCAYNSLDRDNELKINCTECTLEYSRERLVSEKVLIEGIK